MKLSRIIARVLLGEKSKEKRNYFTSAIVVAAGKSTRTGGTVPKQLVDINGIPVIVRTLLAFERCNVIDEVIVVAAENQVSIYDDFKRKYNLTKLNNIVRGGETRDVSVLHGFEAISEKSEFIAIHDGARCLIKPEDIERVVRRAYGCGAAIAVTPSTDTLKHINKKGEIIETLDRLSIVRAQTPQVFMKDIYNVSVYNQKKSEAIVTDDSMLAEVQGFLVKTVEVGAYNIKITTDEDFRLAELLLGKEI